mmetsp:Transcript_21361/g.43111  ORF Transcript_21361/g.43111 Transcript_21361/m.43111 type:complete len:373 (-) Transcript_21361:610-1728(-)
MVFLTQASLLGGTSSLLKFAQRALEPVFQGHVIVGSQAQARPHDVDDGAPLREEGVDDGRAAGDEGSLEHVTEQGQDGMERLPLVLAVLLDRDAFAQFSQDHQVVNERGGQKGILAGVVHHDGIFTPHENFVGVFVHGPLGIGDVRHVLDHDDVIGVFVLLEQHAIRRDHVVHDVRFRYLLGTELRGGAQVLPVVVAQMIVGDDGHGFDPGRNQEIDQDRFHFGLTGFEIVAGDEDLVLTGEFDDSGYEGVLGRAVDVRAPLEDGRYGEDRGGRDLRLTPLDRFQQVLGRVVDPLLDRREALGVGGPKEYDLIETVFGFEVAYVLADLVHLFLLGTGQDVVGPLALIGGDEIGEVDGGEGNDVLHVGVQLLL